MHPYAPENGIFDGPVANLLSILSIFFDTGYCRHQKLITFSCNGEESLNDFKFSTIVGRFPSDTLASMAMKGLTFLVFFYLFHCIQIRHPTVSKATLEKPPRDGVVHVV